VLRLRPDHFWAQCLAAICEIQTNQHGRAQVGLSVCLQREPRFVWLYLLRGFAAGQSAVQARVAGKALGIADGSFEAGAENQFEAAEADYQKALELLEQEPNEELHYVLFVNRALMRFQRGRLDDAVSDFRRAIQLDGRHQHAYAGLAQVFERQKKWDEAVEQLTRAIERKPGWAPLYRDRAAVQMERDDQAPAHRATALNDLEEAIRDEAPGRAVLASDQTARGELLRTSQRFEDALAACAAALDVVPDTTGLSACVRWCCSTRGVTRRRFARVTPRSHQGSRGPTSTRSAARPGPPAATRPVPSTIIRRPWKCVPASRAF
jgi:hypothetical protein